MDSASIKRVGIEKAQNFMRQYRDPDSRELKKLSANQFMDVWSHYDKDGKKVILHAPFSTRSQKNPKVALVKHSATCLIEVKYKTFARVLRVIKTNITRWSRRDSFLLAGFIVLFASTRVTNQTKIFSS